MTPYIRVDLKKYSTWEPPSKMSSLVYVKKLNEETNLVFFQSMCTSQDGRLIIFQIQARSGAEIGEVQPKENW